MIPSLLDNDLYKFTMQQAVWCLLPQVEVSYRFIERRKCSHFSRTCVEAIEREIQCMPALQLKADEKHWLKDTGWFAEDYLDWLAIQRAALAGLLASNEAGQGGLQGTSNLMLAREYGLRPVGTVAHEWTMAMAALYGYEHANRIALEQWLRVYNAEQSIGVTDSVDLDEEHFWRNGRYDTAAIESVFTGDDFRARERVDVILGALNRYQPELDNVRGVGFCAGVKHAEFMARHFNEAGIASAVLLGNTQGDERAQRLRLFREGKLSFLFTVDVLSEGVDVPEINMVLFLRPTEGLTLFLQQLGRGLRHAPGKECLTVLDFVGQTHRKYRLDTKYAALLSRRRQRIDHEIEKDFPHLPPGCSIQLERVARDRILTKIRSVLNDLNHFIPESLQTWQQDTCKPLTFGNFIEETGLSPSDLLARKSWSEWKALASHQPAPNDPDLADGKKHLGESPSEQIRICSKLSLTLRSLHEVHQPL